MTSSKDDDKGVTLAGELIAMIRINAHRGTFATATVAEIEAHLQPWIARLMELRAAEIPTQQQAPESLGSPICSRRFRCANCGVKCRSSKADRGMRKYCRACEDDALLV